MRVLLLLVVLVTGGKQSQLLVRLTWTGMDLDWSLTKKGFLHDKEMTKKSIERIVDCIRMRVQGTILMWVQSTILVRVLNSSRMRVKTTILPGTDVSNWLPGTS